MMRRIKPIRIIAIICLIVSTFCVSVSAEVRNISATGKYIAGASESLNDAKKHALEDALRLATEQAGVLVSSYSETKNMMLTKDEVSTVASKIVKVTKEIYDVQLISDSNIQVVANIDVQIDVDSISEDVNKLKSENEELKRENRERAAKSDAYDAYKDIQNVEAVIRAKYRAMFPKPIKPDYQQEMRQREMFDALDAAWKNNPNDLIINHTEQWYLLFAWHMSRGEYKAAIQLSMPADTWIHGKSKVADKETLYKLYLGDVECVLAGHPNGYGGVLRELRNIRRKIAKTGITPSANLLKEHQMYYEHVTRYLQTNEPQLYAEIMGE